MARALCFYAALDDLRFEHWGIMNMNIYQKLNAARMKLQAVEIKKSGKNTFSGYNYFELSDFLPEITKIFNEVGLCGVISYSDELATLTIIDTEKGGEPIIITSPMSSAALKGCHPVQNVGAVETYQRRYLWTTAMDIVEHDAIEAVTGKPEPVEKAKPAVAAPRITPDQAAELETFALDVGVDMSAFKKHFAFQSFADIPASKYQDILAALKKKAAVAA